MVFADSILLSIPVSTIHFITAWLTIAQFAYFVLSIIVEVLYLYETDFFFSITAGHSVVYK